MNSNFNEVPLNIITKQFWLNEKEYIVCIDRNSVRIQIFYITEAIATFTIGFSYRQIHCIHSFKYIEVLHIKRKILPLKIERCVLRIFVPPTRKESPRTKIMDSP